MLHKLLVVLSLQSSTGISVGRTTRAYQFLSVFAESTFISNVATKILLPSVLLLILVPPKTSRAFSSPVSFMTSHDFEAFGLYPNLGPSLIFLMNRFLIWKISQNIQCNMTLML